MLKNNFALKVVSLVIAIVLWAYVVSDTDPIETQTLSNIPVHITGLDYLHEHGLTIQEEDDYLVSVKVKGTKKALSSIDLSAIVATADVSGYNDGTVTIPIKVQLNDSKLAVTDVKPSKVELVIERIVSTPKNVRVTIDGTVPGTMESVINGVNPGSATVSGPESLVNQVSYIKAILSVDVLSTSARDHMVELYPVNSAGEIINGVSISPEAAAINAYLQSVPQPEEPDDGQDAPDAPDADNPDNSGEGGDNPDGQDNGEE